MAKWFDMSHSMAAELSSAAEMGLTALLLTARGIDLECMMAMPEVNIISKLMSMSSPVRWPR